MTGRLASVLALVIALAAGFGTGRVLGSDGEAPSTTTSTSSTTTTIPEVATSPLVDEGPTLAELVPGLDAPLYMETGGPTQLLRWDPDAPAPVPVRNLPAGTDLTMDRSGRFLFLAMPGGNGQLLLGGLADTPLTVFSDRMSRFPSFAEFTDVFWFLEGDDVVAVTTRGEERYRGPWRPELPDDFAPDFEGEPIIEAADDSGAVVSWWYGTGETVFTRTYISVGGRIDLPSDPETRVVGFSDTHLALRTEMGGPLIEIDKATGEPGPVTHDASCGYTLTRHDGVRGSVCNGVAIVLTDPPLIDVGSWREAGWSGSGAWFMAVATREVLLIDVESGAAHTIEVPLAGQTRLLDIWSGA